MTEPTNIVPQWALNLISEEDNTKIHKVIEQVETTSSAEIVIKVAKRSSTVGHIPVLIATILFIVLQWGLSTHWAQWSLGTTGESFASILALAIAVIGAVIGTRSLTIERLLTSKADQDYQVKNRALLEFYNSDIKGTRDSTGILVFISIMEHRVVVLADEAISKKFPPSQWENTVQKVVSGIQKKCLGQAIESSLLELKEPLTKEFPVKPDDKNELPDHLIFIED